MQDAFSARVKGVSVLTLAAHSHSKELGSEAGVRCAFGLASEAVSDRKEEVPG